MNSTRSRLALLCFLLVFAAGATGCSQSESAEAKSDATPDTAAPAPNTPLRVTRVSGYPLDRSLAGLATMPDVDTIVVVKDARLGTPAFIGSTGPDGSETEDSFIVTPVDSQVDRVYRGFAKVAAPIRMIIGGGQVGDVSVIADRELAPQPKDIARYSRLLVAGKMIQVDGLGDVLDPYFVYGIDAGGRAETLMESAGGGDVRFSLSQLETRLTP